MKIVKGAYEIWDIPEPTEYYQVLKHLERIARVCYKSEKNITDESCVKFLTNILNRKHWAMLEHYIFVFSVPKYIYDDIMDPSHFTPDNVDLVNKMNFIQGTYWEDAPNDDYRYMVSASVTSLNYLWACEYYRRSKDSGLHHVLNYMMEHYPELMKDPTDPHHIYDKDRSYDDQIRFITHEELETMPVNVRLVHDSMTVKFWVDRGATHEFARHRPCSWAQESTRYCNYNNGKFGNEITVIDPSFFPKSKTLKGKLLRANWYISCRVAQFCYNNLIKLGASPSQARTILPHSTKVEMILTARMYQMRHFFTLRADKAAHPHVQEVVRPLLANCIDMEPEIFGDLKWRATMGYK